MTEMKSVAQGVTLLTDETTKRLMRGNDMLGKKEDWDSALALAQLEDILKLLN